MDHRHHDRPRELRLWHAGVADEQASAHLRNEQAGTCMVLWRASPFVLSSSPSQWPPHHHPPRVLTLNATLFFFFCPHLHLCLHLNGHRTSCTRQEGEREHNIYRRPLAWVGILIKAFMPAPMDILAMTFARNSLLVPFSSLPVVMNTFGAWVLFNESVGMVEVVGTLAVVFGCVFTSLFGR